MTNPFMTGHPLNDLSVDGWGGKRVLAIHLRERHNCEDDWFGLRSLERRRLNDLRLKHERLHGLWR